MIQPVNKCIPFLLPIFVPNSLIYPYNKGAGKFPRRTPKKDAVDYPKPVRFFGIDDSIIPVTAGYRLPPKNKASQMRVITY